MPMLTLAEEKGASVIEVTEVFTPPPPSGYQPVRVQVTNATGEKRSWQVEFISTSGWNGRGQLRSSFKVAADSGSTQSTLLVPVQVATTSGGGYYAGGQHQLRANVTSSQGGQEGTMVNSSRAVVFPAIAISEALAQKSLTQLNDLAGKSRGSGYSHENLFGSRFLPDHLPDDWLGYSGFDHVMMTTDEWLAVAPGVRAALMQSAHFGLHIHLYRSNESVTLASAGLAVTDPSATTLTHGMGRLHLDTWDGNALDAAVTVPKFAALRAEAQAERLSKDYARGGWGLERALGGRSFAGWQVVVFLLVFGILIGPVNLFVFAPAGKRHKLFFTTPLISVGASLLLVGLILGQDGTGGEGRRFVAVHLPNGEAAAYVTQEQIARTGVVLGSSFTLPRPGYLAQIVLPESPWAKYSSGSGSQAMEGRIDGAQVSGNWFQSRAVQAQFLRSLVPTRGRIEVIPPPTSGEAPAIVSSLEFDLATFGYLDAEGTLWRAAGPVRQGQPVTLVKDAVAWTERLRLLSDRCSAGLATRISDLATTRPAFLATATAAPGFAIETLSSLRWKDDTIVIFGNLPTSP